MRGNGLDLNTSDSLSHGNRGARSGGYLFGSALDLETYGPNFVGSLYKNFYTEKIDARDCAIPALIYSPLAPNVGGYQPISGVDITGVFNRGFTGSGSNPAIDNCFKVQGDLVGGVYAYTDVVVNGIFSDLPVVTSGVKFSSVDGVMTNNTSTKLVAVNCKFTDVELLGGVPTVSISPEPTLQSVIVAGTPTAVVTYTSSVGAYVGADGGLTYLYEGNITGALNADGDLILQITNSYPNSVMRVNNLSAAHATAPISSASLNQSSVQNNFYFDTAQSAQIFFNFSVTFYPQ